MTVWFDVESRNGSGMIITTGVVFEGEESAAIEDCNELYPGQKVTKWVKRTKVSRSDGATLVATLRSAYEPGSQWTDQSISLKDDGTERSLSNLLEFLVSAKHVEQPGRYVVINASEFDLSDLDSLLESLFENRERLKLLPLAMKIAEHEEIATQLEEFVTEHPGESRIIADGINLFRRSRELQQLRELVEEECDEEVYQKFLKRHYWIFGSEYSSVEAKFQTFDGEELDYLMRRTADGYEEAIEIKRPDAPIVRKRGQKGLAETSNVVDAINQVDVYLASLDGDRHKYDSEQHGYRKVEKVRGKIIIGRDPDTSAKKRLLRLLNARHNRIEVITYDQLIDNAQRMISMMVEARDAVDENDGNSQVTSPAGAHNSDSSNPRRRYPDAPASVDDIPF